MRNAESGYRGVISKRARNLVMAAGIGYATLATGGAVLASIDSQNAQKEIPQAKSAEQVQQLEQRQRNDNVLTQFFLGTSAGALFASYTAYMMGKGYLFWFGSWGVPMGRQNADGSIDLFREQITLPGPGGETSGQNQPK